MLFFKQKETLKKKFENIEKKERNSKMQRSRWQSKRTLTSPPLMKTSKLQLHIEWSSLKLIWGLAEHLLYHQVYKEPHRVWYERRKSDLVGIHIPSRKHRRRGYCKLRDTPWEGKGLRHICIFPGGSSGKESACNAGALGSIPGLGRSPGEGKGCPLQYSGLENSMDCIVTKSWTQLNNFHTRPEAWPKEAKYP